MTSGALSVTACSPSATTLTLPELEGSPPVGTNSARVKPAFVVADAFGAVPAGGGAGGVACWRAINRDTARLPAER